MKRKTWIVTAAAVLLPLGLAAVDVSSSRDQGPAKKINDKAGAGPGFLSDVVGEANEDATREKLDRVSGIHLEDFALELQLDPARLPSSLPDEKFRIQVYFFIQNNHELVKTLSFPSSQKYDFVISDGKGRELYRWSKHHAFTDSPGTTIINPGDKVRFTETIPLVVDREKLPPGQYTLTAILKGHDEFRKSATLTISP